jgi:hypothetical protein
MLKLAALWLKENEKNGKFFVGSINETTSVFIFKNKNKKADNHPDYEIFIAEKKRDAKPAPKKNDDPEF